MEDNTNVSKAIEEVKNANEENLKQVIEGWFERIRTQSMKIGASYISTAIFGVIQKHIKKKNGAKASLRDYQRCTDEIINIISVQLTKQDDSEEAETGEVVEETTNDGTAE
jgi:hypothetical protein